MQSFYQSLLVHGSCAGYNLEVEHTVEQLVVAQCGKLRSGYDVAVSVLIGPQSYLSAYLASCARRVARNNLDAYSGVYALLYGSRHIAAHGVGNSCDAYEVQSVGSDVSVADGGVAVFEYLECKAKCAHGVVLIVEQLFLHTFACSAFAHGAAHAEYDFGRALYVQNTSAGHQRRVYHCSHILALSAERQLVDNV